MGVRHAAIYSRISVPQTQDQLEAALLSVNAKTGGSPLSGSSASRGGDSYTINAIDAASLKQFLARADMRRVLKQSTQDAIRAGTKGKST
jgi:hypothetical protein